VIKRMTLAFMLMFMISSLAQAEIYDTYLPAAKASLKDKKTLIVVIGAEDW